MFKKFSSFEDLYQEMDRDKHIADVGIASANRYPLRFVLFENFCDIRKFVDDCQGRGIHFVGIDKLLGLQEGDVFCTYYNLAKVICDFILQATERDSVISPFSELARFHSPDQFRALVTTIRSEEASDDAQKEHLRIYIPLVGMKVRLDSFKNDGSIFIWEYESQRSEERYQLILYQGEECYIPKDEKKYSYCRTVLEWINLWKLGGKVKSTIICSSKALFSNSRNAIPDTAFEYTICQNAFELLRDGVRLIPRDTQLKKEDIQYWEQLATELKDKSDLGFEDYVLQRFNVRQLDVPEFIQFWLDARGTDFSRWLLKIYFLKNNCHTRYLCRVIQQCKTNHTNELFEKIALLIFEEEYSDDALEERRILLIEGHNYGVKLTGDAESMLKQKLIDVSSSLGYTEAMKLMTSLTKAEKQLMISWLGQGKINRDDIQSPFPDLFAYTAPLPQDPFSSAPWLIDYFNEYRLSKIANSPTEKLSILLNTYNGSPESFESWKNKIKTVRTILAPHQDDIDIYFWIDGLGVDWIPFITAMIGEYQGDGIYLNYVFVGASRLPTITCINKKELERLSPVPLPKIGDLDEFAHKNKKYPDYINDELNIVRNALKEVLDKYNGKKIAFVSDHGISYIAQHGTASALAGIKGKHDGRYAIWENHSIGYDKRYLLVDEKNAICSLTHDSLTAKTPIGQGAHGGATPEEVLVPIIIVSGQKKTTTYSVSLLEKELAVTNPVVRYKIRGLSSIDNPHVEYNGETYSLIKIKDDIYESVQLRIVASSKEVTLVIGDYTKQDSITINTGIEEDDIFGDF